MADLIDRNAAIQMLSDYAETQQDLDYYRDMLMKIPAVNRWIPCSERLPVDREVVLTYDAGGNVRKCEYFAEFHKFKPEFYSYYAMDVSYVTHWMPLPSTEGLT